MDITGGFTYTIEGKFKEILYYGRTSRSKTFQNHLAEPVTIIPFNCLELANELHHALDTFRDSGSVVDFVYLNESVIEDGNERSHVLIEKIDQDLRMLIDDLLVEQHNGVKNWLFYKDRFKRSMRGISIGFSKVFREQNYCVPKLLEIGSVSVDKNAKSKLAILISNKGSDRHEEMEDLARIMNIFLTNTNEALVTEERLKNLGVPNGVIKFIDNCTFLANRNIDQLQWMLDFSGFLGVETIKSWVYMASALSWTWILDLEFVYYLDEALEIILRDRFGIRDWTNRIPSSGIIRDLYVKFLAIGGCAFHCLIRFYGNVFEHYNDHRSARNKAEDAEICQAIELIFDNNLVIILRDVLYEVILKRRPLPGVNWCDMLTPDII